MKLFDFLKNDKKNNKKISNSDRNEKLLDNCGLPFTTEIKDDKRDNYEQLKYSYTDVKCSIIGNLDGMKQGAVLYVRKNGILANVCGENILQIENEKIKNMVNDFFDKSGFSTLKSKYVSANENEALINIGFYISYSKYYDDDSDEEDEEDDDK